MVASIKSKNFFSAILLGAVNLFWGFGYEAVPNAWHVMKSVFTPCEAVKMLKP
jgi:hypothetical protein